MVASALGAQVVLAPAVPQVGSPNTVSAEPPVPHPAEQPCVVTLFTNQAFADFSAKSFSYAPPAACPGPWAKVVLAADFTVTAGRQYDRTAQFTIGNANIFYGTTAEPRKALSPSWHIERDLTDLSALFTTAQPGQAILGNFVGVYNGVTYDGIIYANAELKFYPATFAAPAPRVADVVVPVPDTPGGAASLNTTASQVTQTVTLPRNTEAAYLDVFAQSQGNDEFWYTCVPNDVAGELESCGNTAFRETEITIDGRPAGIAPVFPWVYTGGIDPYLWAPIPGVQTLNFKPYRVNLTPFAGLLADGQAHTVGISVFNADSYFLATANLLVFTDHGAQQVSGAVVSDTLAAAPSPSVTENLSTASDGTVTGTVTVSDARKYAITGYVNTSHGRVETTVSDRSNFNNAQTFDVGANVYVQDIAQSTNTDQTTTTRDASGVRTERKQSIYPFSFNIDETVANDGTITEANAANQKYMVKETTSLGAAPVYTHQLSDQVSSQDTDVFSIVNGGYALTSHTGQQSMENYRERNSLGYCYAEQLTAANGVLTGVKTGAGCESSRAK